MPASRQQAGKATEILFEVPYSVRRAGPLQTTTQRRHEKVTNIHEVGGERVGRTTTKVGWEN